MFCWQMKLRPCLPSLDCWKCIDGLTFSCGHTTSDRCSAKLCCTVKTALGTHSLGCRQIRWSGSGKGVKEEGFFDKWALWSILKLIDFEGTTCKSLEIWVGVPALRGLPLCVFIDGWSLCCGGRGELLRSPGRSCVGTSSRTVRARHQSLTVLVPAKRGGRAPCFAR